MQPTSNTPERSSRRIGVFGGAFDPPHRAHRALAEAAIREFRLDRLQLLPTGQAWHKSRTLSEAGHRLAMCRLAFGDLPEVVIDDREIRRASPSYTADTLEELRGEQPGSALFLIIGEDQFSAFRRWRRWQDLLSMATLVVAARTDASGASDLAAGHDLPFERLNLPLLPVSSTAIRTLAAQGAPGAQGLATLVPEDVARYISTHSLYQQPS